MNHVVVDTGPLVAFFRKADHYHGWILDQLAHMQATLVTCEAVLSETLFLVRYDKRAVASLKSMMEGRLLLVESVFSEHAQDVMDVIEKYRDLPASVADACVIVLHQRLNSSRILTLDSDFLIYRRPDGSLPDLIAPFV